MKRFTQISVILIILFSLFLPTQTQEVQAATYTYTNSVSYNIPDGTTSGSGCEAWPATRYFLVNESFTVNDLNVEFSQNHANRGQIKMTLKAPDGTQRELISTSGDTNDNYYFTLDDASSNPVNDGNADTIGGTRRTVGPSTDGALDSFNGKNAHGTWLMTICDNTFNATGTAQLFNSASLIFDGTPITPTPKNHKQGPAVAETYYLPWPEDQVRTAFTRTFDSGCSNFTNFRDNYDAAPREPEVSYTSLTIVDAGTVVTYDHWEDGYEANLSRPSQNTTQVWGDGDLTNGAAPGDTDDTFSNGQILILDNALLSTTLGSVIDYDARDKIGTSTPINISRSVWSDGSQTLFAAADEVYPVDRWGTQFYSPIGDNANLYNMFDISVVSIIAAEDGTLVDIDKDGNGTYEITGIALNEGGTYFIDDTGSGMARGGAIRSNSGHPIQVNLMTADRCAGYESRTYPLIPFEQWDSSYFLPVSTIQTATGPGGDEAPTTVHVYNPNTSPITVLYDYDTGNAGSLTIPANSSDYAVVTSGKATHFYSVVSGTSNNYYDNFNTVSYSNSDGTKNWNTTPWVEVDNGGNGASGGNIYVDSGNGRVEFNMNVTGIVGNQLTRPVDLSTAQSATLSLYLDRDNDLDSDDDVELRVSVDNWSSFRLLDTFDGDDSDGQRDYTLQTGELITNTQIGFFVVSNSVSGTTEDIRFNWVEVAYQEESTGDPPVFYAVASVDSETDGDTNGSENSTYDWGITMVPEGVMSQWLIVGWAPGDDPTFEGTNIENTAPIWLTGNYPRGSSSTGNFDICVDYNGDCTSGTCTLDPVSGRYYDRKQSIAPLTQVKIYKDYIILSDSATQGDAGEDQTGTSIWVCGPTGSDALITAAWGEDPLVASPSKPGVDLGYTIRNQRDWRAVKSAELQVDLNGNGLYDEGDTVRYTITVTNVSATPIISVLIKDTNDPDVTYVPSSTYLVNDGTSPPLSGQIADSPAPGDFPLDSSGSGYTYVGFDGLSSFSIYYDAVINITEPWDEDRTNVAHVTVGTKTLNLDVTVEIQESEELGAIGNYVWLDEDGDGDQDAGEAGIPNVLVTLTDGITTYTTYTDANGGYIFTDLPQGTWTVTVSPPAGLNPTYDEDGIVTPNVSVVTLSSGEEHLSADFGYNWSTPQETNDPGTGALGAIGDRVWVDVDGEGDQDANEIGIPGVTVELWYDSNGDGVIDAQLATTTTDATGNYIFDDLPAGIYEVRIPNPPTGYVQTGDPDSALDNLTQVVLAPGDVFVNADFGYQPTTADVGQIGDTVWLDANANGLFDANGFEEYGLTGVTVSLIVDINSDGIYTPGLDQIIATDITDLNGNYLFSGLPASGIEDYLVWVNDTENVLEEFEPTYDDDGVLTPNISVVTNLTTAGDLDQDFGYAPPFHDTGDGLIGDTVFLDMNNNGVWDPGEGIEGVVVKLYAADGTTLLGETVTNEDGIYAFGNLTVDGDGETYIVQVQTGSLPYPGLTNTVDPDGGGDSLSTVTLTTTTPVDLDQDFGYLDQSDPNTIGGTIWEDTDADGTLEGTETGRYAGVTVVLRDASGDIVATTVTDANGDYEFTNLPDGTYTVDVTDDANILNGTWHSLGPVPGADNNSKVDPYTVSVSGGETNTTGDFGYYIEPAAVGNLIWNDTNDNGIQDPGEVGIPGVTVTLTISYPNGDTVTLVTTTDPDGFYRFDNLLQDEDHDGSGSGEPTYSLTVEIPSGYTVGLTDIGSDNQDSDGVETVDGSVVVIGITPNSELVMGGYNPDYDFGFTSNPTSVDPVTNFKADFFAGDIRLSWDADPLLVHVVYVELEVNGEWHRQATFRIDGNTSLEWIYEDTQPGVYYTFQLSISDRSRFGPVTLRAPLTEIYMPIINH